jgi:transcription elongation GreA/GreB family factor
MLAEGADQVVRVGSVVRIRGQRSGAHDVMIVDHAEHQSLYHLSTRTPLGRALLGRRRGDSVPVTTGAGTVTFVIVDVGR